MLFSKLHLILIADAFASDPAKRAIRLAAVMAARDGAVVTSVEPVPDFGNPFYHIANEGASASDLQQALSATDGSREVIVLLATGNNADANDYPIPNADSCVIVSGERGQNEATLFAGSGIADLLGDPEREPLVTLGHFATHSIAFATFCALASLHAGQRRFGQQDQASVDLMQVMGWTNWKAAAAGSMGMEMSREGALAEWPSLPCKDGYCVFLFTERDWSAVIEMVGDPRLQDERFATFKGRAKHRDEYMRVIREWCLARTKDEIDTAFIASGVPGASVKSISDLFNDALVRHRNLLEKVNTEEEGEMLVPTLPHRIAEEVSGKATTEVVREAPQLPLSGMRVLDLGIITAGAGVSAVLADLGAEVLKVESSTYPDPFRSWAGASSGDSPLFKFNNRNKHGLAIDLKTAEGIDAFLELARSADIVVENFRRGVLDRLGLTFKALHAANPNIVLASVAGQGLDGPGANHTTFGSTLEASSGFASLTCYEDGVPYVSGRNLNYPDQIICLYGAAVIAAAATECRLAGKAMHLDISQRDAAIFQAGDIIAQVSSGASDAANDIRPLLGDVGTITQVRNGDFVAHGAAGSDFTMKCRNGAEMFEALGGTNGPTFLRSPSGDLVKGFPFQFSTTPMKINSDSPAVGEHNEQHLGTGA